LAPGGHDEAQQEKSQNQSGHNRLWISSRKTNFNGLEGTVATEHRITMLTLFIFLVCWRCCSLPIAVAISDCRCIFHQPRTGVIVLVVLPQHVFGYRLHVAGIPFFILAAALMNTGAELPNAFFALLALSWGMCPAGLGGSAWSLHLIFSGMSGSAVADAASLGQIQHRMVDASLTLHLSEASLAGLDDWACDPALNPIRSVRRDRTRCR
jgi:hypothetical protein